MSAIDPSPRLPPRASPTKLALYSEPYLHQVISSHMTSLYAHNRTLLASFISLTPSNRSHSPLFSDFDRSQHLLMTDFLLQNSTLLAPIVQKLVGQGMNADIRTLVEEIGNDAAQCKEMMTQVKKRYNKHIKRSIDEINFPYEAGKEAIKLRTIIDWVIFESGDCFKITRAELARYKALF